jgi:hypothetical protein
MEDVIEYNKTSSDDKTDWFTNHVLTKEQVAQLIRNKIERAKVYQRKEYKVFFD